jgi:vancomycin resistance protein YoaR
MNALTRSIITGLLGFILMIILMIISYQLLFAGRIFPGVTVSGIDVGGLPPAKASKKIGESISYPQTGRLGFSYNGKTWQSSPADVGVFLDLDSSAKNAFAVGRSGSIITRLAEQFGSIYNGHTAALSIILDQRISFDYLSKLAKEIDIPAVDAGVTIQGTEVIVIDAVTGIRLDRESSLKSLAQQINNLSDGVIPLTVIDTKPLVIEVGIQAELARTMLAEPFTLIMPSGENSNQQSFTLQPADLAVMLKFEQTEKNGETSYKLGLESQKLAVYLTQLASELRLTPINTRYTFNDTTRQLEVIQPAVIGRELDITRNIDAIQEKVKTGQHSSELVFNFTKPAVTDDMTGSQLGITELVQSQTSYFRGSSVDRIQNIKTAASQFHGLLIAPGQTFSMASALGNISLDNGYAEALIIVGDKTIKGVGGGVCQVSTTLFRTAFFSGLPIEERHPHAYRVGYYEQIAGGHNPAFAGLDATVYVPLVDFKFTNDTPYWLLMETYTSPTYGTLTWKFYSTRDGRSVDWSTTGPKNIVEPPDDLYRENPDLPEGEIKQIEYHAQGADVTVNRDVIKNGKLHFNDSFFTHYQPWQAIYEYGPGTELPTPTPSP